MDNRLLKLGGTTSFRLLFWRRRHGMMTPKDMIHSKHFEPLCSSGFARLAVRSR